jgi:[acyl-carrier-protein] S-malonyltransferase
VVGTIVLCPGQGAQKVGMARDLAERFPAARDALQALDEALGFPLTATMFDGPEDALLRTDVTQPAILAHSIAVRAVLGDRLGTVQATMGHSLGEYSAYGVAGVLSPTDAVRLVRKRGELMAAAGDARPGAMSAVLGLDTATVAAACAAASVAGDVAVAANLNAPDQTVISGDPVAVARAGDACKAAGAKRVMPLKVSGAFHSPLMAPAQAGLAEALAAASFHEPVCPVIANAVAAPVYTSADARRLLVEQLTAPVRFVESAQAAAALVPDARWIEIGPGSVLAGLVKKCVPGAQVTSLGTADDVERFLSA